MKTTKSHPRQCAPSKCRKCKWRGDECAIPRMAKFGITSFAANKQFDKK